VKFIKVVNNCEPDPESPGQFTESGFVQEELIPVRCLVKIYRYLPESTNVIVYVWDCPVTRRRREFREKFHSGFLLRESMRRMERHLTGMNKN